MVLLETDKEAYGMSFNDTSIALKSGDEVLQFDMNGKQIKTTTIEPQSSLVCVYNDQIIYNNGQGIYMKSGEENKQIAEGRYFTVKTYGNRLVASSIADSSLVEVNLDTLKSKTVILTGDQMIINIAPVETGYIGLSFDNVLYTFDLEGKIVLEESMDVLGPKIFLQTINVLDFSLTTSGLYLSYIKGSLTDTSVDGIEHMVLTKINGEKPQVSADNSLTLYTHYKDYAAEMMVKNYMAEHDVQITIKSFDELSDEDYLKKINTDIIAGESVDIVSFDGLPADKLIENGFFTPLTDDLSEEEKAAYYQGVYEGIKYNNQLYGLPISLQSDGLFMVTDALTSEAKDYIATPSFENFKAMVNSYTGDQKLFRDTNDRTLLDLMISNQMDDLLDRNSNQPLNEALLNEVIDTLDIIKNEAMDATVGNDELNYYGAMGKFVAELIRSVGSFSIGRLKATIDEDYVLAPFPGDEKYTGYASVYGVSSSTEKEQLAKAFVKYLSTDVDFQSSISMMGMTPAVKAASEASGDQLKALGGEIVMPMKTKYGDKQIKLNPLEDDETENINNIINNTKNFDTYEGVVKQLIIDEVINHLLTGSSREALMNTLNNKLFLYYNE